MMPRYASPNPASSTVSVQNSSAPSSCPRSPSSIARESSQGRTVSPTIQAVPKKAPRRIRTGWHRASHHMYRNGPRRSGVPGSVCGTRGGIGPTYPRSTCHAWDYVRMRVLRTPAGRFGDLPGFPYVPRFVEVADGLRMAYVEDGPPDGEPVLLLHGEPAWSFLYRKVMPVLAAAGLRAIAPDLVGFGRSDKPADIADHTYARHVAWVQALAFQVLDLTGVTLVGQDWGGLIGLRLVAEQPRRFARVVAANTGLPTGAEQMPDVWLRFREAVRTAPMLDISRLVSAGCRTELAAEVLAAYDA